MTAEARRDGSSRPRPGAKPVAAARSTSATFRRRVDVWMLRWQGRLDSEWSDRVLPWLFAFGLYLILELLAAAKVRSLEGTVDLATYTQGIWLINNGFEPVLTITTGANLLAQQLAFVVYPVSLAGNVVPVQGALLFLQSAALALAAVPIWRIARKLANLRVGAAFTLIVVYALYPTMHNLNLSGFYPETLALPLLLYAAYFGLGKHWRRYAVCCVLIVLCRADFGLVVAGLGGLLWAEGRKVEGRISVVLGVAYTVLAVAVLQPRFGNGDFAHIAAFSAFGDSPGSILGGMVVRPGETLSAVFRQQNFDLLITLFAPVAFLPFLAPRYLLPVLPLQFLFLVSDVPQAAVSGQQTVAITAFIFLAAAFALARIGRTGVERITVDRRVLAALLLAGTLFFIRDSASSPYQSPWGWGGRNAADVARIEAAQTVGPDRAVRVSPPLLNRVAERPGVYVLESVDEPDAAAAAEGVDAVVLDESTVPTWTATDREIFDLGLEGIGFEKVSSSEGISVYLRQPDGAPADAGSGSAGS